jgi:hypothetical protein
VKPSLLDRIKEFHEGATVIEDLHNVVPRVLAADAALFQKDRDQIEWFRQMEAIEIQEVAFRFLREPEHPALQDPCPIASATRSREGDEKSLTRDEPSPSFADDGVQRDLAQEPTPGDDDLARDLEDESVDSALAAGEGEDPRAFLRWLRNITSPSARLSVSSSGFTGWAWDERQREHVSRKTVVRALLEMRLSGLRETESPANQLAMTWKQLESQVMRHNVRAALHWAHRHGGTLPDELAFVFALVGMRRAVLAFEPARGWRFLTFASWWIRQSVRRARTDYGTALRVPVHLSDKLAVLKRATGGYSPSETQKLSNAEMLVALGAISNSVWSHEEIERFRHLDRWQRLSDASDPTDPILAIDYVFDESRWMPTDVAPDDGGRGRLAETGDTLIEAIEETLARARPDPRSRAVIYERLGLDGQPRTPTLEQLGQRYGVTRERIRQVEAKGFAAIGRKLGIVTETLDD